MLQEEGADFKTRLAHRCTKEMEIKHGYSQAVWAAGCRDGECSSWGTNLVGPFSLVREWVLPLWWLLQSKLRPLSSLCTFCRENKNLLWISLHRNRYECRAFIKVKWLEANFWKAWNSLNFYVLIKLSIMSSIIYF